MNDFSEEQKTALVQKIQGYFSEELGQEIGKFEAEFLLDFLGEEIGKYSYNQGLKDAQAILEGRMDAITEAISELEKFVD